ncbi:MAG: DUF1559 domain-containing protein [Planctomycetota bacterium]
MSRVIRFSTMVLTWSVVTHLAFAQQSPETSFIEKQMEESAIAVVRLDLAKMTPVAWSVVARMVKDLGTPYVEYSSEKMIQLAKEIAAQGGEQLYLLVGMPNAQNRPFVSVAIPAPDSASAARIADVLGKGGIPARYDVEVPMNWVLVVPTDRSVSKGSPRPNLSAALAAVSSGMVALSFIPSDDQRRVIRELTPDLPIEGSENVLRDALSGLEWLSVEYSPGSSFRLVGMTQDHEAATNVHQAVLRLLDVAKMEAPQESPVGLLLQRALKMVEPKIDGQQLVLSLDEKQLRLFETAAKPLVQQAEASADRQASVRRFKQVGLAFYNDIDAYGKKRGGPRFADAFIAGPNGKPLLSWRVHLLPFLDQNALYKQFHLDEPWDSEHNRALISQMPEVFRVGGPKRIAEGKTCIVLPIGGKTIFPEGKGMSIRDIVDGTSNTILAVEADDEHAVIWTKPEDIKIDEANPAAGLGGHFGPVFLATMADGSVQAIDKSRPAEQLKALFSPNGKETARP